MSPLYATSCFREFRYSRPVNGSAKTHTVSKCFVHHFVNSEAGKSRPPHLMGTLRTGCLLGLPGVCCLFFLVLLIRSVVLTEQSAVHTFVKRHPAASLPLRRAGRTEAAGAPGVDTAAVGGSRENVSAESTDPGPTTVNVPASASGECSSADCKSASSSSKKKPLIKFRPSLMIRGAVPLSDDTYFDFIEANPLVLVLFYAPWCSWSRRTLPEFESAARVLAQEQSGEPAVLLAKVDCTQNEEVMFQEEIEEFPTIKLFVQGRPKVYDGGRQRADILRWVQLHLNQGRTVGNIDSLKEILASRALGTLVVIAAWQLDSEITAEKSEHLARTTSPKEDEATKVGGPLPLSTPTSPSHEQKALRSVASQEAGDHASIVTSSLSDSARRPTISTAAAAGLSEEAPARRHQPAPTSGNLEDVTPSQSSTRSQAEQSSQVEAFSHVARLAGPNVIFGEVSNPQVVQFLMDKYIEPHTRGKAATRIQLPLVAAFPPKIRGPLEESQSLLPNEEIRLYDGRLDDWKRMADFVRASKFPAAVPFSDIWAPKIFDDGRPVCVLFVDSSSVGPTSEETSQASLQTKAFLKVAPEFRVQFLFTISGYSKPHEKRLVTLLGLEEGVTSPQLRIVTFNPQKNQNYYPILKYRPPLHRSGTNTQGEGGTSEEGQKLPVSLPRSGTGGLRTATATQDMQKKVRVDGRKEEAAKEGDDQDRGVHRFEQELRGFLTSYLEGSLEPYLRSEPVPSEEENKSDLKIIVGSTFEKLVRLSEEDVLVEFGAPWCGHCRKLDPTLKLLAAALRETKSKVVLAKMDATRNEVKGLYFVAYPTLVLFPSMRKESPLIYEGDRTEEKLLEWLSRNVRGDRINLEHVTRIVEQRKKRKMVLENSLQLLQPNDVLHEPYGPPLNQSILEEL